MLAIDCFGSNKCINFRTSMAARLVLLAGKRSVSLGIVNQQTSHRATCMLAGTALNDWNEWANGRLRLVDTDDNSFAIETTCMNVQAIFRSRSKPFLQRSVALSECAYRCIDSPRAAASRGARARAPRCARSALRSRRCLARRSY